MKQWIAIISIFATVCGSHPAFADDTPMTREVVCEKVMHEVGNMAISGLISAGTSRMAYKLWRRGGRTLIRRIFRRGAIVAAAVPILAGSGFYSYSSLRASLAMADLCSASTSELEYYRDQSSVGLLDEENESLRMLVLLYGPETVHRIIETLLLDNPQQMEETLSSVLSENNQPLTTDVGGQEFELPEQSNP